jgi:hypothetical protein
MWAHGPTELAVIDLASLHPDLLSLEFVIDGVFEVARQGGDSLLAVHRNLSSLAITVLDARAPDRATSRTHTSLGLRGLQ